MFECITPVYILLSLTLQPIIYTFFALFFPEGCKLLCPTGIFLGKQNLSNMIVVRLLTHNPMFNHGAIQQ